MSLEGYFTSISLYLILLFIPSLNFSTSIHLLYLLSLSACLNIWTNLSIVQGPYSTCLSSAISINLLSSPLNSPILPMNLLLIETPNLLIPDMSVYSLSKHTNYYLN